MWTHVRWRLNNFPNGSRVRRSDVPSRGECDGSGEAMERERNPRTTCLPVTGPPCRARQWKVLKRSMGKGGTALEHTQPGPVQCPSPHPHPTMVHTCLGLWIYVSKAAKVWHSRYGDRSVSMEKGTSRGTRQPTRVAMLPGPCFMRYCLSASCMYVERRDSFIPSIGVDVGQQQIRNRFRVGIMHCRAMRCTAHAILLPLQIYPSS
ncbi:hypothetical protein GGR52DRAFT_357068 [Hypoxylon sp. FL1284]|nr:hypothetical protein GGR52DRAFT_357068 [Hypoxylon sp. FL1284]